MPYEPMTCTCETAPGCIALHHVRYEVRTASEGLEAVFFGRQAADRYVTALREGCGVTDARVEAVYL